MYRIHEIKLGLGEDKSRIPEKIEKRFSKGGKSIKIKEWRIVRESIDARDKGDIKKVYSVDFETEAELPLAKVRPVKYELPERGSTELRTRPVVCGFGPCGIFAALVLAEAGMRPLVLERGRRMEERVKDVESFWNGGELNEESNVQFGEGGAGTFSDGKLTTGIKDTRIRKVLEEFCGAGADEDILYKQKPHIGTDRLRDVVVALRNKIEALGGEVMFESKLTSLITKDKRLTGIEINGSRVMECDVLILALGHSARDTFRMLYSLGMEMEQKPFSIGVRIEHKQDLIDRAQYGRNRDEYGLPPAEYKLSYRCGDGRGVYTFCMCPGGEVIVSSSERGGLVINGMSYHDRAGENANSALLVDVRTDDFGSDHPLAGVAFQERYERLAYENAGNTYIPPQTTWGDFAKDRPAARTVRESLPKFAAAAIAEAVPYFGKRLHGFDDEAAILRAVETRSSSPVRIPRDAELQACVTGVYPAGEGAGYAGGIMSAAVDGIRAAEAVISKYNNIF